MSDADHFRKNQKGPKTRTRVQNLIKLGAPKEQAISVGLSCKGPWRLAKTFGSHGALTNTY
jgi:RNA-directed DNA polymerase